MAIRDVITRGFGNGTYDPGVNDLPTRGYTISTVTGGPFTIDAQDFYNAGAATCDSFSAGDETSDSYNAGAIKQEGAS